MSGVVAPGGGARITLAIPFYRDTDYLARALDSAARQDTDRWRVLVCDDSPGGEARALVEGRGDRFRYVHNGRTIGMAPNWNRCLDLADTDLVTLLHADDELLPGYARVMLAGAERHPGAAALFCAARVIGPDGSPKFSVQDWVKRVLSPPGAAPRRLRGPRALAGLLRVNSIMCPTVCYRRSVIGPRRFDPRWKCVLDLDFFARLLAAGEEFVGLPDACYAYRRHDANATSEYTESLLKFAEESALYDEIAAEAAARGWGPVARAGREKRMLRLHLLFRVACDLARGRLSAAAAKARLLARIGPVPG